MTEPNPALRTCPGTPALATEDLVAWLDGELAPAERGRVEAHVAACPACAREADLLRRTGDLVARLPRTAAPAGFADRVVAASRVESRVESRVAPAGRLVALRRWTVMRVAAAAVVVWAVTLWWMVPRMGEEVKLTAREEDEIARDLYVLAHLDTLQSADADELARIADDLDVIDAVPSDDGNGG